MKDLNISDENDILSVKRISSTDDSLCSSDNSNETQIDRLSLSDNGLSDFLV